MAERNRTRLASGVWEQALAEGDGLARELVDEATDAIAVAVASAVNLLDVEAVIVGGGLGLRFGDPWAERLAGEMEPRLFQPSRPPDVRVALARRPRRRDRRGAARLRVKAPVPGVVLRGSAPALEERFDAVRERLGLPQALPPEVVDAARAAAAAGPRPAERRDLRDVPVRDGRPARQPRPRPGAAPRAARRRLPHPLRDRRRRRVGRARRRAGRRGVAARADASTRPIAARRSTRRSSRRARRACCPTATARPSCWSSTSTATATRTAFRPYRALVRSRRQLAYDEVGPGDVPLLDVVGPLLAERAAERGAIELDAPAQVVVPDDGPAGYRLEWEERRPSEAWNAQISLAANAAVGDELGGAAARASLRTMPPPRPRGPARPARHRARARHRRGRAAAARRPRADAAAGRPARGVRRRGPPGARRRLLPRAPGPADRGRPRTRPSAASTRTPPRRCGASPTATCSRRWSATRSTRDDLRPPGRTSWRPSDALAGALRARHRRPGRVAPAGGPRWARSFDACVLSAGGARCASRSPSRRSSRPARGPRPRPGRRRPRAPRAGRRRTRDASTSARACERRVTPGCGERRVRSRRRERESMATGLSFTGLASGVDTDAIVTALMHVERTPQTRMQGGWTRPTRGWPGFEQTRGRLDALRGAADALRGVGVFSPAPWASSSDTARLTATAGGSAVQASYAIEIQSLARADVRTQRSSLAAASGGRRAAPRRGHAVRRRRAGRATRSPPSRARSTPPAATSRRPSPRASCG